MPSVGSTAMMPMPPAHCRIARQRRKPGGASDRFATTGEVDEIEGQGADYGSEHPGQRRQHEGLANGHLVIGLGVILMLLQIDVLIEWLVL